MIIVLTTDLNGTGLPFRDVHGTADEPIVVRGPRDGPRARFTIRACCNTVSFRNSSYIEIYNLELDGSGMTELGVSIDAVKAESQLETDTVHHILLENLFIHDHDYRQSTICISTKVIAWGWIIRNNVLTDCGTGMYLGNSDGRFAFFDSVIEGNYVTNTIGYNAQIKHQQPRPTLPQLPTGAHTTIIRYNVFSKANKGVVGELARPNLLVGHWPLSGEGVDDHYEIYGNFFYQNPTGEPLFQGEGHIALHHNQFINDGGGAVWIQAHNDVPRTIEVFNNRIVAAAEGLRIRSVDPNYTQRAINNTIFAELPLDTHERVQTMGNSTDRYRQEKAFRGELSCWPPRLDQAPTFPCID